MALFIAFVAVFFAGFMTGGPIGLEVGIYIGRKFDGDIEKCAAEEAADE